MSKIILKFGTWFSSPMGEAMQITAIGFVVLWIIYQMLIIA